MIGTIRKHSKWLWIVIAGLTIISFVVFMGSGPMRGGGSGGGSGYGVIYGQPVTAQEYLRAKGEFYLFYWSRYGQWPDRGGSLSADDIERETYIRLLLARKAAQLGIHIGEDALATAADDFLRSAGRNGQPLAMQDFVARVLAPAGLGVADMENFLRSEITVEQMIQTYGLPGAVVTPQEAAQLYDREHQEVAAQAVFFSASNYLAQAAVTPAAVAQFYTNNLAVYREPDRVQVNYLAFEATNFLAQSLADLTNLTEYVNSVYQQYGQAQFPDAKTPDEAKAKIRALVIRGHAQEIARKAANAFAAELIAMQPARPENLATLAAKKGLVVRNTAPFNANYGPAEFSAPPAFVKTAFELGAEVPYAGPVNGPDGSYILALAAQLPSAIPALEQIRARVEQDFQAQAALALAQRAATNYYYALTVALAAGKTFAQAAVAAGQAPVALPPFSLSTPELPEIAGHATLPQIKQAAFTTPPGHLSGLVPTADGSFVLFVRELLPVDESKMAAQMPQFLAQVRRARQGEIFNVWLQGEANRELRNTPFFAKMTTGGAAK